MKKLLKSKWLKITLSVLFILIFSFFHLIGPHLIVGHRHGTNHSSSILNFNIHTDTISFEAKDGKNQVALFITSNIDTIKGTMTFVHGIGIRKDHYLGKSEELSNKGIQSLLIDLRGHGDIEGDYITYG